MTPSTVSETHGTFALVTNYTLRKISRAHRSLCEPFNGTENTKRTNWTRNSTANLGGDSDVCFMAPVHVVGPARNCGRQVASVPPGKRPSFVLKDLVRIAFHRPIPLGLPSTATRKHPTQPLLYSWNLSTLPLLVILHSGPFFCNKKRTKPPYGPKSRVVRNPRLTSTGLWVVSPR
jgi:hypothetical protein